MATCKEVGHRGGSRSRSPCGKAHAKGDAVQFFHAADLADKTAPYVSRLRAPGRGPQLLQSHGWLDGTLVEAFSDKDFDPSKSNTWPLVMPNPDILFADRSGGPLVRPSGPRQLHPQYVRECSAKKPLISLVFVRWGGQHAVGENWEDDEEFSDGDWGKYGCPASDQYMSALIKEGVMVHPKLVGEAKPLLKFEAFSLFVKNSVDVSAIVHLAPWLAGCLRGRKHATFWMLWPAEWEDFGSADYAGYVDRRSLFGAMRACEAAGLRSGFPHPADQYELITSKSWMSTLCSNPHVHLPAATIVSKANVLSSPENSAQHALASLEYVRSLVPLRGGAGPSEVNRSGVRKGVVKLGWSWEARYIKVFTGAEELAAKLLEILTIPGCSSSSCIVQEWVDFDFEMRLYFLPPDCWAVGERLKPARTECNGWGGDLVDDTRRTFYKLSEAEVLKSYWAQDRDALKLAKKQALAISQHLLAWLRLGDAQPVPMIRLDFMLKRWGPGEVQVVFGEYCEMGACCLGWEEGPPAIWRAALDAVLR